MCKVGQGVSSPVDLATALAHTACVPFARASLYKYLPFRSVEKKKFLAFFLW